MTRDWRLGLEIMIGNFEYGLGSELEIGDLGLQIRAEYWDWRLGFVIGIEG